MGLDDIAKRVKDSTSDEEIVIEAPEPLILDTGKITTIDDIAKVLATMNVVDQTGGSASTKAGIRHLMITMGEHKNKLVEGSAGRGVA